MLEDLRPKAILFDFYATLVDVETDEYDWRAWEVVAKFLRYRGSDASAEKLQHAYVTYVNAQLEATGESHPDIDVVPVFARLLRESHVEPADALALTVAQLFRSLTLTRFHPFAETRPVLETLAAKFTLALVTDSQEAYLLPELRQSGLARFFPTIVISSLHGFRKPDVRMFRTALQKLGLHPAEAVYVGDSWTRDVIGASEAGIHPIWIHRPHVPAVQPDSRDVTILHDLSGLLALEPPHVGRAAPFAPSPHIR